MRHRICERPRWPQRIVNRLRVEVVRDGMTRHQGVIFALTAAQGILSRPNFYAHQRVGRVNDVCPDVDAVDLFDLQQGSVAGVIRALEADRVFPEAAGRSDLVSAIKHLTRRLVWRCLPVCEGLLCARNLIVVIVNFPDDNLPVRFFLPAQAGLRVQPQLS
ncbi:Uncharacterised protein [Enterobacter hormaechei]|nr:Uncharacterised protein [Enterobacter hormaechei]CZW60549.1 Uncharacterised protein [Enterobacter hormaechei]SAA90003.1 Uncharacterised protein [Enterobacter hormaechei]SAG19464.1 Uncharacterised protein [Enterobacter hormaechei]SAG20944.1 Uncharacterised protein [Enterobacter hormaechei]